MDKRELFLQYAKQIKDLGYTVFVSSGSDGYVVNDKNQIGYFSFGYYGINFTTVHKPCRQCGTGFRVTDDEVQNITKQIVDSVFSTAPYWGSQYIQFVKKYSSLDEFKKKHWNNMSNFTEL